MSDKKYVNTGIEFTNNSYKLYEVKITDTPLFEVINTMYVISMKKSTRRPELIRQLKRASLTRKVKILINYGMSRKEQINTTTADLLHANKIICELEYNNNNPIFILEDDCEFCGTSYEYAKIEQLALTGAADSISLGALMHLSYPGPHNSTRIVSGGLTHCMIYSQKSRDFLLKLSYDRGAHDTEVYAGTSTLAPKMPLAVQRHYRTENSLTYDPYGIASFILYVIGADKNPVRTYKVFHMIGMIGGIVPLSFLLFSLFVTMCF